MLLHPATVTELCTLDSLLLDSSIHQVSIIDITYIPSLSFTIFSWFHFLGKLCQSLLSPSSELRLISAWVAKIYFDDSTHSQCLQLLRVHIPNNWSVNCSLCIAVVSGDAITTERYAVSFIASASGHTHLHSSDASDNDTSELGFQQNLSRIGVPNPVVEQLEPLKHSGNISLVEPFVISIIHSSSHADVAAMCSSNCILDPDYPAMKPSPKEYINSLFGRRFGISGRSPSGYEARRLLNTELLRFYAGPNNKIPNNMDTLFYQDWLDENLISIAL